MGDIQGQFMIAFLGDIHGDAATLLAKARSAHKDGATALIQVGDFGVYKFCLDAFFELGPLSPIPIYFIDGNHEDYRIVRSWPSTEPKELVPGKLTYVPRGTVLTIGGLRVGFLGGAGSIDYNMRTEGSDWWPNEEQIKDEEVDKLIAAGPVDVLAVHTPPRGFIDRYFDTTPERARRSRLAFGAAPDWVDPSADKVQRAWEALGKPPLYCGHMHAAIRVTEKVRLLDINELAYHEEGNYTIP